MNFLTINIGKQRIKFIFIYIYYHENKSLKYLINILNEIKSVCYSYLGLIRRIN
jgi:hypothetical protein